MEEAVEFAKKHLGIKNFNLGDDLEMANWVNEGLVGINNRFKGKAQMPKNVIFDEKYFAKSPNAAAYHCAANETIAINKRAFDNAFDDINKLIEKGKKAQDKINADKGTIYDLALSVLAKDVKWEDATHFQFSLAPYLDTDLQMNIVSKISKYKQNPNAFSRFEMTDLVSQIADLRGSATQIVKRPLDLIRKMSKGNPEFFQKNCKEFDYYKNLPKLEQSKACMEIIDKLNENNIWVSVGGTHRSGSKFGILWHEMGHLLHDMNVSSSEYLWGKLSKKSTSTFLADSAKMVTAGKISWYAQTNPKEFVAETFSALCSGAKLPDDVMGLYRFYKGPEIPNM